MRRRAQPLLILLLPALAGCPPPRATLYAEDPLPPGVYWARQEGDGFSVEHTYHLAEFRALCFDEHISRVKVVTRDGAELRGEALAVPLEGPPRMDLFSEKGTRTLPVTAVKRVVFYEPIPEDVRRDNTLTQVILWPALATVIQLGNDKDFSWTGVGVGAGVGLGMGSLFFFKKHQELEKVLFTYEFDTP